MVALGWMLIIIGFSLEVTNKEYNIIIPADIPFRYPWWMVIIVTPLILIAAVFQAAMDKCEVIVVNLVGATVSYNSFSNYLKIILLCVSKNYYYVYNKYYIILSILNSD